MAKPVLTRRLIGNVAYEPDHPLRITIVAGPDQGQRHRLNQPRMLIGRGETADIQLRDDAVSQCHAELLMGERGLQIRDLGSANGIMVGELQVEEARLRPGCALRLGTTVLLVEADEVPADPPPRAAAAALGGLVGESPAMRSLYALLHRLAPTDLSVLIQGETGTGKELAARALHGHGQRVGGPFVVLDCTTIPTTLATSFLFGHEKGAFTGAAERRIGLFEAAHGGVLFIDEVGELSAELQPLLLRVLQQREVVPVGSTRPRPVDIRVISASWRDLRAMVNQGAFREDLYYRLAQATLWMPALDERRQDIPLLVQHFLARLPPDVRGRSMEPEALSALLGRPFPGNVRELQSTVDRLAKLAEGPVIATGDLAFERLLATERKAQREEGSGSRPPAPRVSPGPAGQGIAPYKDAKRTLLDEFEREYLLRLLARSDNNLSRAAALAELERQNLRELLRKHGLWPANRGAAEG